MNSGFVLAANKSEKEPEIRKETFLTSGYFRIIALVFGVVVFLILARLVQLQIIEADKNTKAAIETRTVSYTTNPKRGTIYDRNGNVLAVSKDAWTVCANPHQIDNVDQACKVLVDACGGTISDYKSMLSDSSKTFVYVKRKQGEACKDKIANANIEGLYTVEDSIREYPYGQVAGQIIGSVNVDGNGLCGLELYYEDILHGSKGKTIEQQGQNGMPIPDGLVQSTEVVDGQDIMISIDVEIQQKLEDIIVSYKNSRKSESTNAIILDPETGEVLAAASYPLFNPNNLNSAENGATECKAISSTYEPGSVFKAVSATAILENGVMTPDTEIYCPSSIQADEYTVSDSHARASQTFTFRQIINRSSNVGVSLSTERMGFDKLYEKIKEYRLDQQTGIDFPGDSTGYVADYKDWSKIASYNISFGQGITVTPLQLADFYSALDNNGVMNTPHFLVRYLQSDDDEQYNSYEIIKNKEAIETMKSMLRTVVTDGTGKAANIPGYGVCGKTGTGQIADSAGKYLSGTYYISFCGMLTQASQPLVCYCASAKQSSEEGVGAMFKEIMTVAIERLRIIPQGE